MARYWIGLILFLFVCCCKGTYASVASKKLSWEEINDKYFEIKESDASKSEKLPQLLTLYNASPQPIDTSIYITLCVKIGNTYFATSQYEEALQYYYKAHRIIEQIGALKLLSFAQYNAGMVHYYINNYEKASYYARRSLKNLLEYDGQKDDRYEGIFKNHQIGDVYNLLGLIYFDQSIDDSADYYLNEALEHYRNAPIVNEVAVLSVNDNLAQLYEFTNRPLKAIENYEWSLSIYLKDSSYYDIAWNANHLAAVYSQIDNKEKALEYIQMAKEAAEKMAYLDVKKDVYKTALAVYSKYKITDSLSFALNKFIQLNDSLVNQKVSENIHEVEARYQVEKKEAALQMSVEKSARLNAELENQRLWATVMLIGLGVLAILTAFIYYFLRQKRKVAELELNIKERQLDELMQSQESKAYAAMLRGQDQERERIAQDLHDRLGGTLAALKMSLRRKENKVSEEDLEIVDEAVQEVRNIAHNLSSGLMQKYGLNQALQQLKSTVEKSGGLKFNVFLHPKISILGQGVAVELYRIVQELVNNTIKHAQATEVSLQTNFDGNTFNLIYEDNGKGFSPSEVKSGIGLENIKARVKRLNGNLHIDAEKGRGAIFIIELNRG